MITASLNSLMASMSSWDTSSLTTSSLGKLAAGVVGELTISSGSIAGLALLTVGAEDASEAVKSGEGSTPL